MKTQWFLGCILLVLFAGTLQADDKNEPHIGYAYPAGGQQGTTFDVLVGGQNLFGAKNVHFTGDGIKAEVINFVRPMRNLQQEDRQALTEKMKEVRDQRLIEIGQRPPDRAQSIEAKKREAAKKKTQSSQDKAKEEEAKKEPDFRDRIREELKKRVSIWHHPLLVDIESSSLRQLAHIRHVFFPDRSKQQINQQIAQIAVLRVTIDKNAKPGFYELRLESQTQLSNPIVFQVGTDGEIYELEPNDKSAFESLPNIRKKLNDKPVDLPAVFNGQIYPGDTDRFRFTAQKGQNVVVDVEARSLVPYLADAVPGWFQAVTAVYDDKGNELIYADDFRFDPDPALCFTIPKDGEYEVEIRDSIFRGREDFVYRVRVGEVPFVKSVSPLGVTAGKSGQLHAKGWNLKKNTVQVQAVQAGVLSGILPLSISETGAAGKVACAVLNSPSIAEKSANNSFKKAQTVELGAVIDGRIETDGDEDVYAVECKKGMTIAAEIFARRVNSPMDSLVRIYNAKQELIAWNDDYVEMDKFLHKDSTGLVTHHADSYVTAEIPADGTYYVSVSETQRHGGEDFAYRLELREAVGDFELRVVPASLNVIAGSQSDFCVHVLRKDGFDGKILVRLKDAPKGFSLSGSTIPAGTSRMRMTLTAPWNASSKPMELKLEGIAKIEDKVVRRQAVPAEDIMQAFLYRHLVPREKLMVKVHKPRWRPPSLTLANEGPLRIKPDGTAKVVMQASKPLVFKDVAFEISDAPAGMTLEDVDIQKNRLSFQVKSSGQVSETLHENLIVNLYREIKREGKPVRKMYIGSLPAIPVEVIAADS